MTGSTLILIAAAAWAGLAKGGIAGPVAGAVMLPLLTQVMSFQDAAGLTLILFVFGDVFAMRFYWRQWDMQYIRLLLPMAIVGIVIGTFLLVRLPEDILRRVLGVLTLAVVIYKFASDRLKNVEYQPRNWHGYLAGWASGLGSALANVGGPPVSGYLLLQRIMPVEFVGTLTLYFFTINLLKLPGYFANGIIEVEMIIQSAWALPIIPLGVWVGRKAIGWINRQLFEWLMIILLTWAGLTLLLG